MAKKAGQGFSWKTAGAMIWLVFTLSMAGWWLYLGLGLLTRLESQQSVLHEEILRQKNMLLWEGLAWMVLLVGGGLTLIYLINRERKSAKALRGFLASFSHDIKTALTSLQMQTEIIREEAGDLPALRRLEADVVRLQLQLENSLFLASEENLQFFIESVSLKKTIEGIRHRWPNLQIICEGEALLRVDKRAFESILSNFMQNSQVHGKAKTVTFMTKRKGAHQVEIQIQDDGTGFKGSTADLGRLFERHNPSSGSGVGLYTVVQLTRRMGGQVTFESPVSGGFQGNFQLEGSTP